MSVPKLGDTVRIGQGKSLWTIAKFDYHVGDWYAVLHPVDGYTKRMVLLDRLTVVGAA